MQTNKNKRAPKQISTGAVGVVVVGGGEVVSKHVEQMGKRRWKMMMREESKGPSKSES
jgi:hypothetical protein